MPIGGILRWCSNASRQVALTYWHVHGVVLNFFGLAMPSTTPPPPMPNDPELAIQSRQLALAADIGSLVAQPPTPPNIPARRFNFPGPGYVESTIKCIKLQLNVFGKVDLVSFGKFGDVYTGFDQPCANEEDCGVRRALAFRKCAIKVLSSRNELGFVFDSEELEEELIGFGENAAREIGFMSELKHPNIIEYYDCAVVNHHKVPAPTRVLIKMECMDFSLDHLLIRSKGNMTMMELKPLAQQIGEAMNYLHELGIVHHDIKPGNIMVNCIDQVAFQTFAPDGQPIFNARSVYKLIDFGFARRYQTAFKDFFMRVPVGGTLVYAAPELKMDGKFNPDPLYNPYLLDAYAFGATLLAAFAGVEFFGEGENLELEAHRLLAQAQELCNMANVCDRDEVKPGMIGALFAIATLVATDMKKRGFINEGVINAFDY